MSWVASNAAPCNATLVPMTVEECLDLLGTVTVGRLVFTDRALPVILPVYVSVDGTHVLLRSITGTDVSSIVDGSVITLGAGPIEAAPCRGWSVTVTGRAFTTRDGKTHARPFGVQDCPSADRGKLLRLEAGLVSGHRLCHRPARGSPPSCDSGTSQMTSTPPERRPRTKQLPPS